jgi:uncharacterized protein (DUF362 family)
MITGCTYEYSALPSSIREGIPVVKGLKVFIKPNLVCPPTKWDSASTTRVEVVSWMIEALKDLGCGDIWIGDCGFKDQWDYTLELSKYKRLPKKYGVKLIGLQEKENFHKFSLVRFSDKSQYLSLFGARISDHVLECDTIIDMPKMKIHSMAGVTGAIKNMMGVMTQKGNMHPRGNIKILHKRLRDLYFLLRDRVSFVLMDGIEGSEYCEQYGLPIKSGVLVSGTDMWEVDCKASLLMGIHPKNVPYLKYIHQSSDRPYPKVRKKFIKHYERSLHWGGRI